MNLGPVRSREMRSLVQLVSGADAVRPDLHRDLDVDEIVRLAALHRVELAVLDRIVPAAPDRDDLARRRDELRRATQIARMQATRTLALLREHLSRPFLVVKGITTAVRWYADPDHRVFADIDLLVAREDFGTALAELEGAGATPMSQNWHGFARHGVAEIPLRFASSTIDLHWQLVALAADRAHLELDIDGCFERSVSCVLGDVSVSALDGTDALLHHCVNTGLEGARQLSGLNDIAQLARRAEVDGAELARRAHDAGATELTAAVLRRTQSVLGAEAAGELARHLRPTTGWLASNRVVDRLGAPLCSDGSVAPGLWLASGRASRRATGIAAARRAAVSVQTRRGRPSPADSGGALDWQRTSDDPDAARSTYLADVEGGPFRVERWRDPSLLEHTAGPLEPRTSQLLGAAMSPLNRRGRVEAVVHADGTVAAVLVTGRWVPTKTTGYPLLLDPAAAATLASRIDRLGVTDITGFGRDILALRPLLDRWRTMVPASAASLPAGFTWGAAPNSTRRAEPADLDAVTDLIWKYSPQGYPNRWLLRRRVRQAIDDLVIVSLDGDRIIGAAARDTATSAYHSWAHIVLAPEARGAGRSWDLMAAALAEAAAAGVGVLGFFAASNPMTIPEDALVPDTWYLVRLALPRRVPGERRVRRALDRLMSAGTRPPDPGLERHREPGADDARTSHHRSQRWWLTR